MEAFKCLVRILDQSYYNWPAVLCNVGKARQVCSRMGKMLRREGPEPRVSAMFYWKVFQAVLLSGAETWVFPESMTRNLEVVHVGFLRHITGQREVQRKDGTWRRVAADKVIDKAGTQSFSRVA